MAPLERMASRHLERQVADPALRARLTPDYTIGCKRILLSSTYYPALQRPDVDLITQDITEITETGVVHRRRHDPPGRRRSSTPPASR